MCLQWLTQFQKAHTDPGLDGAKWFTKTKRDFRVAEAKVERQLDRFTLRGQGKVTGQWLLMCLVHNIEKLAHYGARAA